MEFARAPFSCYQIGFIQVELEVGSPFFAPPTTSSDSLAQGQQLKLGNASGLSSILRAKGLLLLLRQAAGLIFPSLTGL